MSLKNTSQEEKEDDIQRYMQLRDDINTAIEKIDPSITKLNETTKRFVAHFSIFQKLSEDAREQMKSSLNGASREIAHKAGEQLSQKIDSMIKDKIKSLDYSLQNAERILNETMSLKYRKLIFISCMGVILSGLAGFGIGHFYAKKNTYTLPREIITLSAFSYQYKQALEKMTPAMRKKLATQFPALPIPK